MSQQTPRMGDYFLVAGYCTLLFTLVLAVGGPLTMHEGVLSQTVRQMAADQDWLVPHFGEAPWLERPPLPQWISVAITALVGCRDAEWAMRLGSALSGTITVLLAVWIGGALFGRGLGILSGLVLATMYEFLRYSTLAEADIYLSPIVAATLAVFVYMEIVSKRAASSAPPELTPSASLAESVQRLAASFVGGRPWAVLWFFVLLGMTNLAKGVVFGPAMALIPIGGYLLSGRGYRLCCRLEPMQRYCWLWGWLACAVVALAWPIAVYQRFPDAVTVWHYDLFGRLDGDYTAMVEPFYYYFEHWFWVVLPWPIVALIGLQSTFRKAYDEPGSGERLLWCWALLTPLVFSFPRGKHHHYMLHFLAPWGILAAVGLRQVWERARSWPGWLRSPLLLPVVVGVAGDVAVAVFTPRVEGSYSFKFVVLAAWPVLVCLLWWFAMHPRAQTALAGSFLMLLLLFWVGFTYKSRYLHRSNGDTAFLRQACTMVPPEKQLLVHASDEALEGLRVLFYCPDKTMLLHNMSFLHDDRLTGPDVWVIARRKELRNLRKFGEAEVKLVSEFSRREEGPQDRWTLFQLHMKDDVSHVANRQRISPMQAMYREPGPFLGE